MQVLVTVGLNKRCSQQEIVIEVPSWADKAMIEERVQHAVAEMIEVSWKPVEAARSAS